LHGQLLRLVDRSGGGPWLNRRGGIYLLNAGQVAPADLPMLTSAARMLIDSAAGDLAEQLDRLRQTTTHLPTFTPIRPNGADREPPPPLERPADLQFTNGLGGFSADGREYCIYLADGAWTPAPWINVLAMDQFGCLASDSGPGYTWAVNSGEHRLTPWRNDPVSDQPPEALHLRDEETGRCWSPTPLPIREAEPYLIRHSAGYTIYTHHSHGLKQELQLFTAPDAPVKIARLRLENCWSHTRPITAT
jgi:cyclic beta-1,2-glucan synthetase